MLIEYLIMQSFALIGASHKAVHKNHQFAVTMTYTCISLNMGTACGKMTSDVNGITDDGYWVRVSPRELYRVKDEGEWV